MKLLIPTLARWFSFPKTKYSRKLELDLDTLDLITSLSKRQYVLLKYMITHTSAGSSHEDLIVEGDYKTFDYNSPQQFYRDRNVLAKQELIVYEGNQHVVNPVMLKFHGRKQRAWLKYYYEKQKDKYNFGIK